jgi:16S rRNA G966 N2-methylase RsmD
MIRGIAGKEKYDIIFIDPPYKDKIIAEILKKIVKADIMSENSIIICESGDEDVFYGDEELRNNFTVSKVSRYAISYVTVLRNKVEME